jgi:hypothetical protein
MMLIQPGGTRVPSDRAVLNLFHMLILLMVRSVDTVNGENDCPSRALLVSICA